MWPAKSFGAEASAQTLELPNWCVEASWQTQEPSMWPVEGFDAAVDPPAQAVSSDFTLGEGLREAISSGLGPVGHPNPSRFVWLQPCRSRPREPLNRPERRRTLRFGAFRLADAQKSPDRGSRGQAERPYRHRSSGKTPPGPRPPPCEDGARARWVRVLRREKKSGGMQLSKSWNLRLGEPGLSQARSRVHSSLSLPP